MFSNKLTIFLTFAFTYLIGKSNADLCKYNSQQKYSNLMSQYPDISSELKVMSQYPIPIWYTDKDPNSLNDIKTTLQNCQGSTSVVIIYGMPNKDCAAGESSGGTNNNENDYINFINNLQSTVNNQEIIYILEPDAIALSINNQCGVQNNYIDNIKNALNIISQNLNAKIYLDIGYWVLIYGDQQINEILQVVNQIDPNKKIKGFSLNLSNYRTNVESINSCQKLRDLSGNQYTCIIDTSRNANGPNSDNVWCNLKTAGIGDVPTNNTGNCIIDYFLWLKPAIEVDGHCYGSNDSYQSNQDAGGDDPAYFQILWDNGILKNIPTSSLRCGN
jgi:cellulase/cellobiase CelA1